MRKDFSKTRRRAVIASVLAATIAVGGCASAPPPKPLARIALLPVVPQQSVGVPLRAPSSVGVGVFGGGDISAIGAAVGMAAIGIGILLQRQSERERAEIERTVAAIGFDPAARIDARLRGLLEQRGVAVTVIPESPALMNARRSGDFRAFVQDADAILDMRLNENGFYRAGSSEGYSPMLGLAAVLRDPASGTTLNAFGYYADWRTRERDPRWITTPPTLLFPSLDAMLANADAAREGLNAVADRMLELLAADIKRRADGVPPSP